MSEPSLLEQASGGSESTLDADLRSYLPQFAFWESTEMDQRGPRIEREL